MSFRKKTNKPETVKSSGKREELAKKKKADAVDPDLEAGFSLSEIMDPYWSWRFSRLSGI